MLLVVAALQHHVEGVFETLDVHHDGYITRADFYVGCERLGIRTDPEILEELWNKILAMDVDHDGQISMNEFKRFAVEKTRHLRQTFQEMDRDKDGTMMTCCYLRRLFDVILLWMWNPFFRHTLVTV